MHNHSNKDGGHKGMMWMMLICILPLIVLLFVGRKLFSAGYILPILIGACVVAHIWMMRKGHGEHSDTNAEEKSDLSADPSTKASVQTGVLLEKPDTKDEHKEDKRGGCCH